MISQQHPLLVRRLITFAAHRIASSTEHQESQIRGEITYQNWLTDRILLSMPLMRRISEFGGGISMDTVILEANQDERYIACQMAIRECQMKLQALKKSLPTIPAPQHFAQAEAEVMAYLQSEDKPTYLSKREMWHLSQIEGTKVSSDWQYFGDGYQALTEPVLETFTLGGQAIPEGIATRIAYITRNSYGVLCLNTPQIMFADIDLEDGEEVSSLSFPWGERKSQQEEIMQAIAEVASDYELKFEIYRTCKGFRLLEMSRQWIPTSAESSAVLERMGSDRLYQSLCITQDCYRARLEIKPWRAGDTVCHHISTIGNADSIQEAQSIRAIHDKYCVSDGTLA